MDSARKYREIVAHYEACFHRYGDTHLGVDWPNARDAETRYRVMLDVVRPDGAAGASLLDFGCGTSHLYEYMLRYGLERRLMYSGLDLSTAFVKASQDKFPDVRYYCADLLAEDKEIPEFDYVVMNGVFTEKRELTQEEMIAYFRLLIAKIFPRVRIGLAFNVMSKLVDWEREDLFHLPFDTLAAILTKEASKHFVIRHDYHLYEYTVYVYR